MIDAALLWLETAAMLALAAWAIGRAPYMEVGRTPIVDVLAVTAIGMGAAEHALYNLYIALAPGKIAAEFGAMDRVAMTLLWVGLAVWVAMPMIRRRRRERART